MKPGCYLSPYTKINSKLFKELNIRPETTKYIDETVITKLMHLGHRKDFINLTQRQGKYRQK